MATQGDARLIIEFSQWAHTWGFHESNSWVYRNPEEVRDYGEFVKRFPPGTSEHRHPFTVLGYFENIGLFYKHDVIDKALLFDWLDYTRHWRLLGAFALGHRKSEENQRLWRNFERLASDQAAWKDDS